MNTQTTEQEREALRRWYGDDAPRMEALFASATAEAYDEAVSLGEPTFPPGDSQRAARRAAWDIINRGRDAAVTARETVLTIPGSKGPRLTGFLDGLRAAGRTLDVIATEDGAGRWTYRVRSFDAETDAAVRTYGVGLGEQELFGLEVGR